MQGFELTPEQVSELRIAHRKEREKRPADKIKAVILLGTGWTLQQVSEALLLDEETLRTYVSKYKNGGLKKLLKTIYMGRIALLAEDEKIWLTAHVENNIYAKASDIEWSLYQHTGKRLSIRTMTRTLQHLGFSYKKTKLVPGKANPEAQQKFIEYYEQLKKEKSADDAIFFIDSTHPTHNVETGYAWIKTGEEKQVLSNSGRQRISVNGAIDIENMQAVSTRTVVTNAKSIVQLLKKIEEQSRKSGKIHVILDNARYNHSKIVRAYVKHSRITLHYLPPYSPNLNPIERLWKFFKSEVIKNKYYATFNGFKLAIKQFFQYFARYRMRLRTLLTDNFRVVNIMSA
jgi:transposase